MFFQNKYLVTYVVKKSDFAKCLQLVTDFQKEFCN